MKAYISKYTTFGNLYSNSKCEIASITTEDNIAIHESMLSKGDLIFDVEGSCGIVKTIANTLCVVLVVNKSNNKPKSNINAVINRI